MTDLKKAVRRRTNSSIRDGGKSRRLVVTIYPGGVIGLRPEKTRRDSKPAWSQAVKMRIAKEKADKKKQKKERGRK